MKIVKTVYSADKKKLVEFFLREDGSFGFETSRFYESEYGDYWAPYSPSCSFCDSLETAEREAWGRIDWMIAESQSADRDAF